MFFIIPQFELPPDLSGGKISICFKMALAKITIIWLKPNIKLILKDGLKPIPIQICNKNREFYISSFKLPPDLSKTMFFIIPQFELPPDLSGGKD